GAACKCGNRDANDRTKKGKAMNPSLTDTIDRHGDPLAFRLRQGRARSPLLGSGGDVIKGEARQVGGHQKEAVVSEGAACQLSGPSRDISRIKTPQRNRPPLSRWSCYCLSELQQRAGSAPPRFRTIKV